MTLAGRRTIGSVMPAADLGPQTSASLWALWTGAYRHNAAFRNARSALAALLADKAIVRLWLPAYLCDAAAQAAASVEVIWYGVGADLDLPTAPFDALKSGDAVLAVDYFGRSPPPAFRRLAASRRDVLWIEDRAQALAPDAEPWGDVLLYSPRKLFGLGDGGLLVSDLPLPQPALADDAPERLWAPEDARAEDPDGGAPQTWFPLFQQREAAFAVDGRPISRRSLDALSRIDPQPAINRRKANYARLSARLGDYALWPGDDPWFAPLAFPVAIADRDEGVRRLARHGLFCARHWAELPCPRDSFGDAWALAARTLSIPCDQRYDEADMDRAADLVLAHARPAR